MSTQQSTFPMSSGPKKCSCVEYRAIAPACEYGCFIAEIDENSGAFVVSVHRCPLHYGSPHYVTGCPLHAHRLSPAERQSLRQSVGKIINHPRSRVRSSVHMVPIWQPSAPVPSLPPAVPNSPSPSPSPQAPSTNSGDWEHIGNSEVPASPSDITIDDWHHVPRSWDLFLSTAPPSPTESFMDWATESQASTPAPANDTDYNPDEDDAAQNLPSEYYVYHSDGSDNGSGDDGSGDDDDGDDDGSGSGSDDEGTGWQPGDNWTIADQIRILGEPYSDYLEH